MVLGESVTADRGKITYTPKIVSYFVIQYIAFGAI